MTATAVTSVCADPPSLLVCINGSAAIHDPLLASKRFCVNLLRVGQEAVSAAFGGKLRGMERFGEGTWALSDNGIPFLETAQANVFCGVEQIVPYGTHSIVIGGVEDVQLADHVSPLLYENGKYAKSATLALRNLFEAGNDVPSKD